MDTELYRTFLAIGDTGSFTAAAREVGRTQSAVSQQVKRLEEMVGHPLFDRAGGRMEFTEHGKALVEFARAIAATQAQAMAAFKSGSFEGIVVVGIPDAYLKRVLTRVIGEFMGLYPRATVNVVIGDSATLARRAADGTVDIAFVTEGSWPTRGPVVFRDRLVVIGPAHPDLSQADPLPLSVWDERNFDEGLLIAALEKMNRRYRVVHVCRNVQAQHAIIAAGHCCAILAESSMITGERAYLEADGFPVLRQLTVRLERSHVKKSKVIDRLEAHFLQHFAKAG